MLNRWLVSYVTLAHAHTAREQFEQLIQPMIDRTVGPCKQALKDAGPQAGTDLTKFCSGGRVYAHP